MYDTKSYPGGPTLALSVTQYSPHFVPHCWAGLQSVVALTCVHQAVLHIYVYIYMGMDIDMKKGEVSLV